MDAPRPLGAARAASLLAKPTLSALGWAFDDVGPLDAAFASAQPAGEPLVHALFSNPIVWEPPHSEGDRGPEPERWAQILQRWSGWGIDLNAARSSDQATMLHVMADAGNLPMLQALLLAGADPNRCDHVGNTPLYRRGERPWASRKSLAVMSLLFAHGARMVHDPRQGTAPSLLTQLLNAAPSDGRTRLLDRLVHPDHLTAWERPDAATGTSPAFLFERSVAGEGTSPGGIPLALLAEPLKAPLARLQALRLSRHTPSNASPTPGLRVRL